MKYIIIPIFRILSLPFLAIALIGLLIITFLYFLFWELNIKRFTSFWRKEIFNSNEEIFNPNKVFLSNATWYEDFLFINEEEIYVSYYKTFWDYLFYRKKYTIYKGKETIYE